jgi:hypothetical protein
LTWRTCKNPCRKSVIVEWDDRTIFDSFFHLTRANALYPETFPQIMQSLITTNKRLLYWRLFIALFYIAYISWRVSLFGWFYWYFITDWNWGINVVYFLSGAYLCYTNQPSNTLHKCLFAIVNSVSWIATIVFWSLLNELVFSDKWTISDRIDGAIGHSVNLLFPLIDLFLSTTTIRWIHSLAPILFVTLYSVMIIIVRLVDPAMDFPYSFLELVNGGKTGMNYLHLAAFNTGLCLILLLFVLLTMGLVYLRDKYQQPKDEEWD